MHAMANEAWRNSGPACVKIPVRKVGPRLPGFWSGMWGWFVTCCMCTAAISQTNLPAPPPSPALNSTAWPTATLPSLDSGRVWPAGGATDSPPTSQPSDQQAVEIARLFALEGLEEVPADFSDWTFRSSSEIDRFRQWQPLPEIEARATQRSIWPDRPAFRLDIGGLIGRTLMFSKRQQLLQVLPIETRQQINQEYGLFDPTAFVRSQFDVQNLEQRREDNQVVVGIRKPHLYGGAIEVNQLLGVRDNGGAFLLPNQGLSAIQVIYTQELLRDGGKDIVLSRGIIASHRFEQQHAESLAESNLLIQQTIHQYWQLYRARVEYYLQAALTEIAAQLFVQIEERSNLVERSTNSLEQARALYFEASADLISAQTRVLQAQDSLFRLVNDPSVDPALSEIITVEQPHAAFMHLEVAQEMAIAMANRPEVRAKISAVRQTAVDLQVSLNQLMPKLSLSLGMSMNGFDTSRDYWGAFGNMGDRPASAAAGLNMEWLLINRTAKAKNKEAQLRMSRLILDYEDQLQQIREEVAVAVRVVNNASPKVRARILTLESRQREIDAITEKIWINPEEGGSMVAQLEQLFQAINRLTRTQQQLVESMVELQVSMVDLQNAKGLLVNPVTLPTNQSMDIPGPLEARELRNSERLPFREEAVRRVQGEPLPDQ